jgi:hypothetical protein
MLRAVLLPLLLFAQGPFPHRLDHAPTPEKRLPETMPGGIAVLDFDADGWPDLFFTNAAAPSRLYRNLQGKGWQDVTAQSQLITNGYTMGAAAADFDADGFPDLFVTGLKQNWLFRNLGNGQFASLPFPSTGWSVSAGWFDYDLDGDLDLFIVNYVQHNPASEPFCGDAKAGYRTYCHPRHYAGLPNSLFRNDGSKGFTDVSAESRIARHTGKGMGLAFADYNRDGWLDVLVTNDAIPDFLFRNNGDGTFTECGAEAGIALNDDGRALSSMGADFRDLDDDGLPDIFITALANETFPLYRGLPKGLFADITYPTRIGAATMAFSGWSTGIFDFDHDGRKDIFAANGDVNDNTEVFSSRRSRQPNLILWQQPGSRFRPESLHTPAQHRGAAFADFNRDGAIDIALSRLGQEPFLWLNDRAQANHWLIVEAPLGAQVRVGRQWNHVTQAVGYASSSEPIAHFGLAQLAEIPELEVRFPSGATKLLTRVKPNQRLKVRP